MKYLAILKDSLRETLDSKLLYVTFALSSVLLLFVGSVSFRPLPLRDQLEGIVWIYDLAFGQGAVKSAVGEVTQTNDAAEPWLGDYRFTMILKFHDDKVVGREGRNKQTQLEFFVREVCWFLKDVKSREIASDRKNEIWVEFTSQGTRVTDGPGWNHEPELFFGALPLGPLFRHSLSYWIYWTENRLINFVGAWVAVLVGIIVTASFVPNMLHKGAIDLLLAKPIHRWSLLVFKYLGGLAFVFLNALFAIGGIWLLLGLRTGIWAPGFLLSMFIITFYFAVLYAVSTLIGLLTRSPIISILVTCVAWLVIWLVGLAHNQLNAPLSAAEERMRRAQAIGKMEEAPLPREQGPSRVPWLKTSVRWLHRVLPRTDDLGALTTQFLSAELLTDAERQQLEIARELPYTWGESVGVCLAYIVGLLGMACWRFSRRDY